MYTPSPSAHQPSLCINIHSLLIGIFLLCFPSDSKASGQAKTPSDAHTYSYFLSSSPLRLAKKILFTQSIANFIALEGVVLHPISCP